MLCRLGRVPSAYYQCYSSSWPVLLCTSSAFPLGALLHPAEGRPSHSIYMVVIQDTRGRFASEGDFYPFKYESADGYDTIEWAAALPNSNGHVGTFGGSY